MQEMITMKLSEQKVLQALEQGNYKYYGFKIIDATINTNSLDRCSQGIIWNPATVNKGKLCGYTTTLKDKQDNLFTIEGQLQIVDIIETNQKNPSLVLQDIATNIVAGLDLEIQTSSFINSPTTVMSKVLGCTIYEAKERESHIHCSMPTIHHIQDEYPSLYLIISSKSIYVGITYRLLSDRIYEHCTYKWKDATVKRGKRTYDMIAYEDADVYCIGRFTDYTIDDIEAMSEEERAKFHTKMESVETIFITLASKQFPHLELVNRKQILKDEEAIIKHLAKLPFINVEILWELLSKLGFSIPRGIGRTITEDACITYEDSPTRYYVPKYFYDNYVGIIDRHKDIRHLNEEYYFDYAMMAYLLLPHKTEKQCNYFLNKVASSMCRLDKREIHYIDYDTIEEQLTYSYKQLEANPTSSFYLKQYEIDKQLYENRHLYKFVSKKIALMRMRRR